jgi:hypothetical protein
MLDPHSTEIERALRELLEQTSPSEWVQEMIAYYQRTGAFRPTDLRRLLGDPSKGVSIGPGSSVEAILASINSPTLP